MACCVNTGAVILRVGLACLRLGFSVGVTWNCKNWIQCLWPCQGEMQVQIQMLMFLLTCLLLIRCSGMDTWMCLHNKASRENSRLVFVRPRSWKHYPCCPCSAWSQSECQAVAALQELGPSLSPFLHLSGLEISKSWLFQLSPAWVLVLTNVYSWFWHSAPCLWESKPSFNVSLSMPYLMCYSN